MLLNRAIPGAQVLCALYFLANAVYARKYWCTKSTFSIAAKCGSNLRSWDAFRRKFTGIHSSFVLRR
jgi:hypothetical protein